MSSRPRLSRTARLRFDPIARQTLLLYPERGLVLEGSALSILQSCTGSLTVAELIRGLAVWHGRDQRDIEADILGFLEELSDRGLLTWS